MSNVGYWILFGNFIKIWIGWNQDVSTSNRINTFQSFSNIWQKNDGFVTFFYILFAFLENGNYVSILFQVIPIVALNIWSNTSNSQLQIPSISVLKYWKVVFCCTLLRSSFCVLLNFSFWSRNKKEKVWLLSFSLLLTCYILSVCSDKKRK